MATTPEFAKANQRTHPREALFERLVRNGKDPERAWYVGGVNGVPGWWREPSKPMAEIARNRRRRKQQRESRRRNRGR